MELTPIVFVAGASAEPDRVRWAMEQVLAHGWILAHDWLDDIKRCGVPDEELSRTMRQNTSIYLHDRIQNADALWLLAPEEPSTGAWVELGLAIAEATRRERAGGRDLHIVISGSECDRCIYASLGLGYGNDLGGLLALDRQLNRHDEE